MPWPSPLLQDARAEMSGLSLCALISLKVSLIKVQSIWSSHMHTLSDTQKPTHTHTHNLTATHTLTHIKTQTRTHTNPYKNATISSSSYLIVYD